MSFKYRFIIILFSFLCSSSAYAIKLFLAPLYWKATETIDWVYNNSLTTPNQIINYKTIDYHAAPGFRIGGEVNIKDKWDTEFYYTRYYVSESDSTTGNLTSAFLGAKLAEPSSGYFYQAGQVTSFIRYNMLDWNVGKRFQVYDALMLRPLLGLEGGWINQGINTSFQGQTSVTENIKNNFSGVGPKMGIEGSLRLYDARYSQINLVGTFATSYLLGHWSITDNLNANPSKVVNIHISNRNLGALSFQALLGLGFDFKNFSMQLGYEINDWFNQFQVFDNDTGAHNNDLILQGLTLEIKI